MTNDVRGAAIINSCRLVYELRGAGAPTIMTVHGGPGLSDRREPIGWVGPLVEEFRCVFYDQRGNGESDDPDPATLTHAQYVADLEALRAHLGLERMALFGGSYGGFIAMLYARRYPERCSHLILRGTAPTWHHALDAIENGVAAGRPGLTREVLERGFDGLFQSNDEYADFFGLIQPLYAKRPGATVPFETLRQTKHWHYQTHNAFFSRARGDFWRYDIRGELPRLSVPTLIISGRQDWITPTKYSEEMAALIPNARLVVFEGAGHAVHADEPEAFRRLIREFLASVE